MYENYRKMMDANTKGVDKWLPLYGELSGEHPLVTLTRVVSEKMTGHMVRSPSVSWWSEMLTGNLDGRVSNSADSNSIPRRGHSTFGLPSIGTKDAASFGLPDNGGISTWPFVS
jgi:hypothetical protein